MQIQCLISKNSWVDDNYKNLIKIKFSAFSKKILFFNNHKKLRKNYDINLIFSYFKKIPSKYLKFSKFNLVIHGSDLPYGRGMSPISWQILKGKSKIVNIEKSWTNLGLKNFDTNKIINRGEFAIIVDHFLNPFKRFKVDFNGDLIYNE